MSSGRVSVCLPARDEEATVGPIVATIVRELVEGMGVVDEVVVVDDGSTDATAAVAAAAGAVVVAAGDVLAGVGPGTGKGEALWKSLYVATGDVLVFCDADLRDFDPAFVTGLIGPLALRGDVGFVKGFYERPVGGGRVTELVARPMIGLFFPELAAIRQPLGGEFAARREVLERVPFVQGYGVDLALPPASGRGALPRPTSASAPTATGRSTSSGLSPPPCCGPPWRGPGCRTVPGGTRPTWPSVRP